MHLLGIVFPLVRMYSTSHQSTVYQVELVRAKVKPGTSLESILTPRAVWVLRSIAIIDRKLQVWRQFFWEHVWTYINAIHLHMHFLSSGWPHNFVRATADNGKTEISF